MAAGQGNLRLGGFSATAGLNVNLNGNASAGVNANLSADAKATAKVPVRIDSTVNTVRNAASKCSSCNYSSNQDYATLAADLARRKVKFEDTEFPATDKSLYYSSSFMSSVATALGLSSATIEWKRPTELEQSPQFIVDGATRFDIDQGALGDCWFLASIGALCMHDELFQRVVDVNQNQNFNIGLFHFRFWHYGDWVDVCIDDRLPTVDGKLIFLQSREKKNEFWSALFEKAYAKLNGGYESLKGGSECEAMEDFTGGIAVTYNLRSKTPTGFFDTMIKANMKCSLLGCSIDGDLSNPVLPNGLVVGHAYTVTDACYVDQNQGGRIVRVPLVRVRNPWGNATEWNGAWSDSSDEWNTVQSDERQRLLTKEPNGEWWMSFTDWTGNFDACFICYLGPDSLDSDMMLGAHRERWNQVVIHGEWVPRVNAGGCANNRDSFWSNPQYHFTVPALKSSLNSLTEPNVCIGLMQADRRQLRAQGLNFLTIGFVIYKLTGSEPPGQLPAKFFQQPWCAPKSPQFIDAREIVIRESLPAGEYLIVPSTFQPNVAGKFIIRIFTEFEISVGSKDEPTGINVPQRPQPQQPKVPGQPQPPQPPTKPVVPNASNPAPNVPVSPQLQPAELAKLDGPVRDYFQRLAEMEGDERGEIDAWTLQKVLNNTCKGNLGFPFKDFSIEATRSLIAMLDTDMSGRLSFSEFKKLWCELRVFGAVFARYDDKKTGVLNSQQLREAYRMLGINVSNKIFHAIVMRYCDIRRGEISFDDFVLCMARFRTALESFHALSDNAETATFSSDDYVQTMIYI